MGIHSHHHRHNAAITELESEIAAVHNDGLEEKIIRHQLVQKLFALDRAQAVEIRQLRATVDVLTDLLVSSGTLAQRVLDKKLGNAMDRIESEMEAARREELMVKCADCGTNVSKAMTHIEESGEVCDACHYGVGA